MKPTWIVFALAAALATAAPQARATFLPVGGSVTPGVGSDPLTGTTIVATTGPEAFDQALGGEEIKGTATAWAVTGYSGNPFGLADYTFVYRVTLTGGSTVNGNPPVIERLGGSAFGGFQTDVSFNTSSLLAGTVVPSSAVRSSGAGNVVSFGFSSPGANVGVGQTSALVIVNTDARFFTSGTVPIADGITATVPGYSPAVPEPSSLVLAGIGLPLGYFFRRRLLARRAG
jgi:hypothetical protein